MCFCVVEGVAIVGVVDLHYEAEVFSIDFSVTMSLLILFQAVLVCFMPTPYCFLYVCVLVAGHIRL